MRILILHDVRDPSALRRTSLNHAFCLLKYAPEHEYHLHCMGEPVTGALTRLRYDAIILDTTFLCWRWGYFSSPDERNLIRDSYRFVADSDAFKIALPQDEYDHSAILDEWLAFWSVDTVYSVCFDHRLLFYPLTSRSAEIVPALTGYVDDADIALCATIGRPFERREIDVGYRAKFLPPQFGRFGRHKAEIGNRFVAATHGRDLRIDISTDPASTLVGSKWLEFLGNCRFTLGCESGSSILDPRGNIRSAVMGYMKENPTASFEEVERAAFPGDDGRYVFSAISPRIFEASLAGCCQILTPGRYLPGMEPNVHYISLEPDMANIDEVLARMAEQDSVRNMIRRAGAFLIDSGRFSYRSFVEDMLRRIERGRVRDPSVDCATAAPISRSDETAEASQIRHRLVEGAVGIGAAYGARLRELAAETSAAKEKCRIIESETRTSLSRRIVRALRQRLRGA